MLPLRQARGPLPGLLALSALLLLTADASA
jgi:hypothetical protein